MTPTDLRPPADDFAAVRERLRAAPRAPASVFALLGASALAAVSGMAAAGAVILGPGAQTAQAPAASVSAPIVSEPRG